MKIRGILEGNAIARIRGASRAAATGTGLESPGFSRNERLSRFLRFVVEGHLDGKDHELKESVIAVEVFGRRPDFDSRLDPVVRTEAVRLRARLNDYYLKEGKADALVIELPKGGYVPRFRESWRGTTRSAAPPCRRLHRRGPNGGSWVRLGWPALVIALATRRVVVGATPECADCDCGSAVGEHQPRSAPTTTLPTALPMNSSAICPSSTD